MKTSPHPHTDTFSAVKEAALNQIESLCHKLIPGGKINGQWYTVQVPWRNNKKRSLWVSLTTANWKDWGEADGGTIIDLVMKLDRCDAKTARDTLAAMLGMTGEQLVRPKRTYPACAGCQHCWHRYDPRESRARFGQPVDPHYCTVAPITFDGELQTIRAARRNGMPCGPTAQQFVHPPPRRLQAAE